MLRLMETLPPPATLPIPTALNHADRLFRWIRRGTWAWLFIIMALMAWSFTGNHRILHTSADLCAFWWLAAAPLYLLAGIGWVIAGATPPSRGGRVLRMLGGFIGTALVAAFLTLMHA